MPRKGIGSQLRLRHPLACYLLPVQCDSLYDNSLYLSRYSMKYLATLLLLASFALPARGQLQQAPAPSLDGASLSTLPAMSAVRSAPARTLSPTFSGSTGLTPYLNGLQAPRANDEFPATVPTLSGPFVTAPNTRPVDTRRVLPSSIGGWLLRGVVETVCANATDNSSWGAAQCDGIGRRAYGYPRFRSGRYR